MTIPFTLGALLADKATDMRYIATSYDIPSTSWKLAPYGWDGAVVSVSDANLEGMFTLLEGWGDPYEAPPRLSLAPDDHEEVRGVLVHGDPLQGSGDVVNNWGGQAVKTDWDVRLQALTMALEHWRANKQPSEIVETAVKFYCFLSNVNEPDRPQEGPTS